MSFLLTSKAALMVQDLRMFQARCISKVKEPCLVIARGNSSSLVIERLAGGCEITHLPNSLHRQELPCLGAVAVAAV